MNSEQNKDAGKKAGSKERQIKGVHKQADEPSGKNANHGRRLTGKKS